MKALVAYAPGELRIIETDIPKPGPGEVLARVAYSGICATDVSIMKGELHLGEGLEPIYPVRLGHEWSGVVEETGPNTKYIKKGDRIISETAISCGVCEYCLSGEYQRCGESRAIGTIGDCWPGSLAEYMLLTERLVHKLPDNVDLEEAALVEPSSIGLCGLLRAAVGPGKNLLVIGTGPIGLGGMAAAKGMGVGRTLLAGRKDKKLEIGRRMGADVVINMTRENLRDIVMRETDGRGMDIIMDTTGAGELVNEELDLLSASGILVLPGFYEGQIPSFDLNRLIAKNCTLIGAATTANVARKVLDLVSNRHIDLKPMITDRFSFEDVIEAFNAVTERNDSRVKVMVKF
ncbi:MAG: zinc-dependent alcohol dehydrogenase [Acetivibrionales bacterium]|jgi:L-iditol 2-dehydrogenase